MQTSQNMSCKRSGKLVTMICWQNHDCTHLIISRAGGVPAGPRDFGLHDCTLITAVWWDKGEVVLVSGFEVLHAVFVSVDPIIKILSC